MVSNVINGSSVGGWFWYKTSEADGFIKNECGKWMFTFKDQDFAKKICEEAIENGICWMCKCNDMSKHSMPTGVAGFYTNASDIEHHRKIIEFMKSHDLIRRTKSGRYYNNSFKFEDPLRQASSVVKLEDFIDLETGEWRR